MTNRDQFVDKRNQYRTKSMFWETRRDGYTPMFSLKDYDHVVDGVTYPSLKLIYLSFDDPTEYEFATAVLGGWKHWQALCNSHAVKPFILQWREEQDVKLRSQGVRCAIKSAEKGGFQASKWLADKGWEGKRGRPSKAEVEGQRKQDARITAEVDDDLKRLHLN